MLIVKVNDSIQLDLATNKVQDIIKFEVRDDTWRCLTFQENKSKNSNIKGWEPAHGDWRC